RKLHCMKKLLLIFLGGLAFATFHANGAATIADVFGRQPTSLNGKWHVIVDPYDTGFFDYRHQPYDAATPITGGFALDAHAKDKTDFVEYNFDTSPTLN